jgi:hypothetical protein
MGGLSGLAKVFAKFKVSGQSASRQFDDGAEKV